MIGARPGIPLYGRGITGIRRRLRIVPSFGSEQQPQMMRTLKLLPRTNCRECGEPTYIVFAVRMAEGVKEPDACPPLSPAGARSLTE